VNTHSELRDHAEQGRQLCEATLALFGIQDDPNWQDRPEWNRLKSAEQHKLAEDARELLLLLAGASDNRQFELLERAAAIRGLPPSSAVWRARAARHRQLGEAELAIQADQRANEIPPTTARDFYLLATTLLQSGEPDRFAQAIRELREALKRDPRHYWSWMQKGLCHLERNEPQLALADFGVCIGLWPEFAWGYFNRAFTLDQLGQKGAAVADYTAALDRDSELLAARHNRGMARLELGQNAEALADFDGLIEAKKTADPALFALRGQALEGLHRSDEADAAFEIALNDDHLAALSASQKHQLLCSFGFAVSTRRPRDADQAFASVPSDDPKYAEALYGRGLLAANGQRVERAAELFAQALERRPNFGEARRFRAILLARLGRFNEAITEINAALQAAPSSGPTQYAAACVTALAVEQAPSPIAARQAADEAIRFLRQALAQGYGQHAATDDDLKTIWKHPEFERVILQTP
jgi:tetratricopeptide (TPR) repeat protein